MQHFLEACALFMILQVHKCKPVQNFLETETVTQLSNPSYSPDLSPCDIFLFTLLKTYFSRRRYELQSTHDSTIVHYLQGVPPKVYISSFRAWILRQETEYL